MCKIWDSEKQCERQQLDLYANGDKCALARRLDRFQCASHLSQRATPPSRHIATTEGSKPPDRSHAVTLGSNLSTPLPVAQKIPSPLSILPVDPSSSRSTRSHISPCRTRSLLYFPPPTITHISIREVISVALGSHLFLRAYSPKQI